MYTDLFEKNSLKINRWNTITVLGKKSQVIFLKIFRKANLHIKQKFLRDNSNLGVLLSNLKEMYR